MKIRQVGPCFAGEVSGIDLTRPLSEKEIGAVHAGMDTYAVLVFRGQVLSDEQQLVFSRGLGELEEAVGASLRAPASSATSRDRSARGPRYSPVVESRRARRRSHARPDPFMTTANIIQKSKDTSSAPKYFVSTPEEIMAENEELRARVRQLEQLVQGKAK